MSNAWFRMYAEFASDPKVQMMSEVMQRRLVMLFCMRCGDVTVTLSDAEIAFHLRISEADLAETKALFMAKGFIDSAWNIANWEKRQFASDSSAARTRAYRERMRDKAVTSQVTVGDALDTDTDTDKSSSASAVADAPDRIPFQSIADAYNRAMTGLAKVRELTTKRKGLIRSAWTASAQRRSLAFWEAYFAECQDDDFLNGTGPYREPHANWRPTFDYLLRADVVTKVFERAMDRMERGE
ncbi:hypothetical protein [Pseudoxanthomonas sp. PXM05]|uniref:hypothetical protein n=1 Tax=Pseudoxanthomonas sp. PXM05 TaxID=2854775 RepID=UPI001C47B761|nr:hypothetical protein [Pseudoxanthomonas sp. PXM05]MBV7475370.1 hypothetical protein [Pseudoxanthomonas sp. PXM05]